MVKFIYTIKAVLLLFLLAAALANTKIEVKAAASCSDVGGVCCCESDDATCLAGPCDTYGYPGCGQQVNSQPPNCAECKSGDIVQSGSCECVPDCNGVAAGGPNGCGGTCSGGGNPPPPPPPSSGQCGDPCEDTTDCNYPNANCNLQGVCGGSGCNNNPPPPAPSYDPVGNLDGFICTANSYGVGGWAGDRDDINLPMNVDIYVDEDGTLPFSDTKKLGYVAANQYISGVSAEAICNALGGSNCSECLTNSTLGKCKHRTNTNPIQNINTTVNNLLRNGNPHNVYAVAKNTIGGGSDVILNGSPKSVTCPASNFPFCTLSTTGNQNLCVGSSMPFTANCGDADGNLRKVEIYSADKTADPNNSASYTNRCTTEYSPFVSSGSCSGSFPGLLADVGKSFWISVNGTDGSPISNACSSNPWCEWEPDPSSITCGPGFRDCNDVGNDWAAITVQNVGTPTITPTQYCAGGTTPTNDISWSGVTCGNTYQIFRCTGSTCTPTTQIATTGSNFYADTNITGGTTYRYRIRGVSAAGGYTGSYSNIVTITAPTCINPCSAPTLNVAKVCNASYNSDNTWSWNSVSGATSYRLQVDNNSNFTSPEVNTVTLGASYVQSNVASGTVWYGRVRVETSNGTTCTAPSAYSAVKQTDGIACQSCTVALVPVGPLSMYTGQQQAFQAVVTKFPAGATAQKADFQAFSLNFPAPITLNPTTDNAEPFTTTATAANPGTSGVSATVTMSNGIATCTSNTVSVSVTTPSCTIDLIPDGDSGNPYPLDLGDQVVFTGNVTTSPVGVPVTNVTFTSTDGNILTSCPPGACTQVVDTSGPPGNTFNAAYESGPLAEPLDRVDVNAVATISGGITCPATPTTVEIQDVDAWWQASGGDTLTTNRNDVGLGTLASEVPDFLDPLLKFINDGADNTSPGMPIMGGTASGVDQDNVSSKRWLPSGNTATAGLPGYDTTSGERYDYAFFSALVPDGINKVDVNNATIAGNQLLTLIDAVQADDNGYKWVFAKHTSGLIINNNFNLAGRKVILFVESATGNLVINGNVAITDGTGFFLAISNNEIRFGPGTSNPMNVEGLYVADTVFDTCSVAPCSNQFRLRGTAVAWSNMVLERDLAASGSNFDTPAEVFTFAPDLIMNYPSTLALPKIQWREVAP